MIQIVSCTIHSRPFITIITIKSLCEDFRKFISVIYSNKTEIPEAVNMPLPSSTHDIFMVFPISIPQLSSLSP